jgi:ubiquinone biosynthesis protein Coq4
MISRVFVLNNDLRRRGKTIKIIPDILSDPSGRAILTPRYVHSAQLDLPKLYGIVMVRVIQVISGLG